jgi:hypothetical protein
MKRTCKITDAEVLKEISRCAYDEWTRNLILERIKTEDYRASIQELDNLDLHELDSLHKNDFQYFDCDGINHFLDYIDLLKRIRRIRIDKKLCN